MTPKLAPVDVACQLGVVSPGASVDLLSDVLPHLAGAGYRRVVLPRLDRVDAPAAEIRDVFTHHQLAPIAMAGVDRGADVGSSDRGERQRGRAMLQQAVDSAVAVGADQLNGVPYAPFGTDNVRCSRGRFRRAARIVGEIADEAFDKGVTMTFEVLNRYETSVVNTAQQALDFVEASGSDRLLIHLDTFHMAVEESGLVDAVETALPKLGYIELGQSGRGGLERGVVDVPGVVAGALDAGYTGRWGIEAFARHLLPEPVADRLSIWRSTYQDGINLALDAQRMIRRGWDQSSVGRRVRREERAAATA